VKNVSSFILSLILVATVFAPVAFNLQTTQFSTRTAYALDGSGEGISGFDTAEETVKKELAEAPTPPNKLPHCMGVVQGVSISGCIAQIIYYLLFVPTSYLFALTGMFFDFTFAYSINDASYRVPFITQGWALLRDVVNMFFIFVLLFVAFQTIVGTHGVKTKETIKNVIVIGILINFSLFATQVIVDTSNILARVFYNDDAITITKGGANGVTEATIEKGVSGEIPLSAALVNGINPQNLILNAEKVSDIKTVGNANTATGGGAESLSAGTFILVTILAIIINIVGMITFLSVGLIFISRVIGLWFVMIFAPLAFFSYTVPSMKNKPIIGWTQWWEELFNLSVLAPIFIFFLYLILRFVKEGFNFIDIENLSGIEWVMAIMIPFIFIMVLLLTAKKLATEYSGTIGKAVTGGISALGGVAMVAATGGLAAAGRGIGGVMARASRGETLSQRFADPAKRSTMSIPQKVFGGIGAGLGANKIFGKTTTTGGKTTVTSGIGKILTDKQKSVEHTDHARHTIDEAKNKAGFGDVAWSRLSAPQMDKVLAEFKKGKKEELTKDMKEGRVAGVESEVDYKNKHYSVEELRYRTASGVTGPLSKRDEAIIEKNLSNNYSKDVLSPNIDIQVQAKFDAEKQEAEKTVSPFDRAVSQANTGSWDPRNLSSLTQDKRESFATRALTGFASFSSGQIRGAIKNIGFEMGTAQKDFIKELTASLAEALKQIQIDVKVSGGAKKKGGDDHGGGGGHH